jgi:hypothetical protein
MLVMFILLQKWIFDGKFQICQISLLPTNSVIPDHTVYLSLEFNVSTVGRYYPGHGILANIF